MPAAWQPSAGPTRGEEGALDLRAKLDAFLAEVQFRALKIARIGTGGHDDAMDLVQDAMLRLARKYARRPADDWPALFYRILQNRIRDWQRRRAVRQRVAGWLPGMKFDDSGHAPDPFQQAPDRHEPGPERRAEVDGAIDTLESAVGALPARQQQAFLLRALEGLDVRATAAAMGCSEGSVKTHYSRAVKQLRERLGEHWQ